MLHVTFIKYKNNYYYYYLYNNIIFYINNLYNIIIYNALYKNFSQIFFY